MRNKHQIIEEPCEIKVSCTVWKTNGAGDSLVEFNRSSHEPIEAIHTVIAQKAKYVLDADITKCFDRINHQALLSKLHTFPTLNRLLKLWLKSGVMDANKLFPTDEGTPQGEVISPLLANIVLHGLEDRLKQFASSLPGRKKGKHQRPDDSEIRR
jgi:RNA-directed DNA polymerase